MVALHLRPAVVANNLVVKFALADGRPEQLPPAATGGVKTQFKLIEDFPGPGIVEPRRASEHILDAVHQLVGLGKSSGAMRGVAQFRLKGRAQRQRQLAVFPGAIND